MVPCASFPWPMNPLQGSGVSERSRCGAVRILAVADEPSTGIGRVGSLANTLRGSGVSERSRCGAVPILELAGEPSAGIGRVGSLCGAVPIVERFRRRGEGGGGERGEEGGGRRREGAGRREEEGGGKGGGRRAPQHVDAPQQVERRPAVPGLAVAQLRRRDGGIRFGRGVVGGASVWADV